jgi:hypothetical protein
MTVLNLILLEKIKIKNFFHYGSLELNGQRMSSKYLKKNKNQTPHASWISELKFNRTKHNRNIECSEH